MLKIPSNPKSERSYRRSSLRLSQSCDKVSATISSFVDDTVDKYVDGVHVATLPQAKVKFVFPTLATENNDCHFNLRFYDIDIKYVIDAFYLYELEETPKANSSVGKWILNKNVIGKDKAGNEIFGKSPVHAEDGTPIFNTCEKPQDNLALFMQEFKLIGSVHKLYSILRENQINFDLADLADSITGCQLNVRTYFHTKLDDYTISTTDFKSTKTREAVTEEPRAKAYTSRRRNAGNPW